MEELRSNCATESIRSGRVESVNEAFDQVRQVGPYGAYKGKKKSKVRTL